MIKPPAAHWWCWLPSNQAAAGVDQEVTQWPGRNSPLLISSPTPAALIMLHKTAQELRTGHQHLADFSCLQQFRWRKRFMHLAPDKVKHGRWKRAWKFHWKSSNDGIAATKADAAGKLLQEARDGAGGAGGRGAEPHRGAVGCQEDLPHGLQAGLPLRREGAPAGGGGDVRAPRQKNTKAFSWSIMGNATQRHTRPKAGWDQEEAPASVCLLLTSDLYSSGPGFDLLLFPALHHFVEVYTHQLHQVEVHVHHHTNNVPTEQSVPLLLRVENNLLLFQSADRQCAVSK